MYVTRYKTKRRHVAEIKTFSSFVHVATWLERHENEIIEVVVYAAGLPLTGTRIESCRLAQNPTCSISADGKIHFHRDKDKGDIPLIMAWNRRNHPK